MATREPVEIVQKRDRQQQADYEPGVTTEPRGRSIVGTIMIG
jgi:hypothetical protein